MHRVTCSKATRNTTVSMLQMLCRSLQSQTFQRTYLSPRLSPWQIRRS